MKKLRSMRLMAFSSVFAALTSACGGSSGDEVDNSAKSGTMNVIPNVEESTGETVAENIEVDAAPKPVVLLEPGTAPGWIASADSVTWEVADGGLTRAKLPAGELVRVVFDQPIAAGDRVMVEATVGGFASEDDEAILIVGRWGGETPAESRVARCAPGAATMSCSIEHVFEYDHRSFTVAIRAPSGAPVEVTISDVSVGFLAQQ